MTKLLGIALLSVAIILVSKSTSLFEPSLSPVERLSQQIVTDVEKSMRDNGIPLSNGIHHVDLKYRSEKAHDALSTRQPKFTTLPEGKIWLEIEILDVPGIIPSEFLTQTSVFDKKTNNKISEFAHAYKIESSKLKQ